MTTKEELKELEQEYIRNSLLTALGQEQESENISVTEIMEEYRNYIKDNKGIKKEIAVEIELQKTFKTSVANSQGLLLNLTSFDFYVKDTITKAIIEMLDFRLKILNDKTLTKEEAEHITDTITEALALEKSYTTASYLFLNILGLGVKQEELNKPKFTLRNKDIKKAIIDLKKINIDLAGKLTASLWLYENYCFDVPYIVEMDIVDTERKEVKKVDLDQAKKNDTFENMVETIYRDFYEVLPRMKGAFENEETRA